MRRLRELPRCRDEDRRSDLQEQAPAVGVGGTSVKIHHDGSSMSNPSSTSLNISIQSGLQQRGASSSSADVVRSRAAVGVMGAAKPARRAQHLRLLVVSELRSWLGPLPLLRRAQHLPLQ